MKKIYILLVLAVSLSSVKILAQEQSDGGSYAEEELYDLSLEELLNVKVTTASKTEETVRDAPGVVSVITAEEIESYGATNLNEVLDRVTGLYMTGSFLLTDNLPSIRGETNAHWATKVLLLIDGRPYRESFLGGNLVNALNGFPLGIVERIEVIRGPGSVLYGTNAYMGVINIILKESKESYFTSSTRYGSFNTKQANISTGLKHKELTVDASLNLYRTDGWEFKARDEAAIIRSTSTPVYDSVVSPAHSISKDRDDVGVALHSAYKGFTMNVFYGSSVYQTMTIGARWVLPASESLTAKPIRYEAYSGRTFVDLGYEKEITSFYTTAVNVTWNKTRFDTYRESYMNKDNVTLAKDLLAEWSNKVTVKSNLNAITGFVLNNQRGNYIDETKNPDGSTFYDNEGTVNSDGFYIIPDWNETWYSSYAQFVYNPVPILKIVGGVQANKVTGVDWTYSPRFATILNAKSGWGGKLLYGSAFRSATPGGEKKIYNAVLHGNPNLLPETVNTSEVQLFVVKKKFEASANYFYSKQTDQIVRAKETDGSNAQKYVNSGGSLTSQGVEAESKFYFNTHWSGIASFASQTSEDDQGNMNYSGAPLHMAKLGIRYKSSHGIDIGVFNTYYSKGGNIKAKFSSDNTPDDFKGTATDANPKMKAINYMTVNVQLNLPELLGNPLMADVSLFCYAVNVLDQKVNYPEFTRRNLNTYPGRAGFNIHGGVKVQL